MKADTGSAMIIISYQNVVGNYNCNNAINILMLIISYQNVVGNYNKRRLKDFIYNIISYQNVVGNYNLLYDRTSS